MLGLKLSPPSPPPAPPPSLFPTLSPGSTSSVNHETASSSSSSINRQHKTVVSPSSEVIDVESWYFTLIPNRGTLNSNAISVEQYDNDIDSSFFNIAPSSPLPKHVHVIDLSDTEDDDDVRILNFKPQNTAFGKRKRTNNNVQTEEKGESSNSAPFVCEICTDTKTVNDSFPIIGCSHVYCKDCVAMYVESKLQENVVNIKCPVSGCRGLLEAEDCRAILAPQVLDRWGKALCEAVITAEEKFYCPFGDCSALLIRDGAEDIKESECPNCVRLFCALCRVPWHQGITCEEFQKLNSDEREKEDIMLMNLAMENKWKRCPNCRFYVAKSEGCMFMKCRCGFAFCYNCGVPNTSSSHYCKHCRR